MTSYRTSAYRILVVDNEPSIHTAVNEEVEGISGPIPIDLAHALSARDAIDQIKRKYFDLVLLDLHFGHGTRSGYEVYRSLTELTCAVEVLLMSHLDFGPEVKILIGLFGVETGPKFVGFLDKREQRHGMSLSKEIQKRYEHFLQRHVEVENLELPVRLIQKRRKRYTRPGTLPLRNADEELAIEIDRLVRHLYVEIPVGNRKSQVSVSLSPMERRGLSASIVVVANVHISLSKTMGSQRPYKTVLKIGPKDEIYEEASRYQEFVKYGVELDQRVELLGVTALDSLGAIVYSFAGGLHRKQLWSLDEALLDGLMDGNVELAQEVLGRMFTSRHWYELKSDRLKLGHYFAENYNNDLGRSVKQGLKALQGLPDQLEQCAGVQEVHQKDGYATYKLSFGSLPELELPDSSVLGLGIFYSSSPGCLVHGDMHGGNVLLEIGAEPTKQPKNSNSAAILHRICLIDFQHAGPGPRCIDAAALESSIRLADSEAACRKEGGNCELKLSAHKRAALAPSMAKRFDEELALYRHAFQGSEPPPQAPWAQLALEVLSGLHDCFEDVTLTEYLGTSIRYVLRQLGYEDLLPVARTRLLAWLAAQYSLVQELSGDRREKGATGPNISPFVEER